MQLESVKRRDCREGGQMNESHGDLGLKPLKAIEEFYVGEFCDQNCALKKKKSLSSGYMMI